MAVRSDGDARSAAMRQLEGPALLERAIGPDAPLAAAAAEELRRRGAAEVTRAFGPDWAV